MADTQRTLTAILTLLADNSSGDISPQDLRDAIVSIFANYAAIGVEGGSTAQTSISATPAKVTGFTTDGLDEGCLAADQANDRLTAAVAGTYLILWSCSFYGTSAKTYLGEIYAGSAAVPLARWRNLTGTSPAVTNAAAIGVASLTAGQHIEAYISTIGGSSDSFTPVDMILAAVKIG